MAYYYSKLGFRTTSSNGKRHAKLGTYHSTLQRKQRENREAFIKIDYNWSWQMINIKVKKKKRIETEKRHTRKERRPQSTGHTHISVSHSKEGINSRTDLYIFFILYSFILFFLTSLIFLYFIFFSYISLLDIEIEYKRCTWSRVFLFFR